MLRKLREQVQSVLYALPARRKPALRRSDAPDALFATDLPLVVEENGAALFIAEMECKGWRVQEQSGWLKLDMPVPVPDAGIPDVLQGECGCCISLLMRHGGAADATGFIREVVKASDASCQVLERLCMQLHGEFAARLRRHEPLPGALLPYLCEAHIRLYQ